MLVKPGILKGKKIKLQTYNQVGHTDEVYNTVLSIYRKSEATPETYIKHKVKIKSEVQLNRQQLISMFRDCYIELGRPVISLVTKEYLDEYFEHTENKHMDIGSTVSSDMAIVTFVYNEKMSPYVLYINNVDFETYEFNTRDVIVQYFKALHNITKNDKWSITTIGMETKEFLNPDNKNEIDNIVIEKSVSDYIASTNYIGSISIKEYVEHKNILSLDYIDVNSILKVNIERMPKPLNMLNVKLKTKLTYVFKNIELLDDNDKLAFLTYLNQVIGRSMKVSDSE